MKKDLIKSNYYEAVNGAWLQKAEIPNDQPSMSAFLELHLGIEKTLMELGEKWLEDSQGLNNNLQKFLIVFQKARDFSKREQLGTSPINSLIEKVSKLQNLGDLEANFYDFELGGVESPFGYSVMEDFLDSKNQVMYFGVSGLILPDTSYYAKEETKAQLLGLWQDSTTTVLKLYGLEEGYIQKLIADTIKFDSLLVPITKSRVEEADYVKMYNPVKREDIVQKIQNFNLMSLADALVKTEVDQLIIPNLDVIAKFDEIFSPTNFEIIKSWMIVNNYLKFSGEFTENLRVAGGVFSRALSGTKEAQAQEKAAFYKAYNYFSQIVGLYYGETYFGAEAKKDVETMVQEMINVYKSRIQTNDWLQESTKVMAIKKLETLHVLVGYPDELPKYYDLYEVLDTDTLFDFRLKVARIRAIDNFEKYHKAPNRKLWSMPASMVNAYYNPFGNQIVFPAAILQKPYYSRHQSISENFGGIGAVIAHEISHAFDNNGAKFDENGSLNNWWTEEDLKAFEDKQKAMIDLFEGVETGYGPCNGLLTVSENIADSGGIRCALEASKSHKDHNLELFFKNWARVWRQKAHPEYLKLLLTVDVHGPSILRANVQLSNLEEFQNYYDIKGEDKMYLDKTKMVSIW